MSAVLRRSSPFLLIIAIACALGLLTAPSRGHADDRPDFIIASITATPDVASPGHSVEITFTVKNLGGWCVGCFPFSLDFYKNRTTPPVPLQSGDLACQVIPPGPDATSSCTGAITYSSEGTYTMWAQADTYNGVGEANESNNILGPQTLIVSRPADYVVQNIAFSPTSPLAGQPVDVTVTVRNLSDRACISCDTLRVDYYKGSPQPPGPLSVGDFWCEITPPAAQSNATCAGTVTYALGTTYQMWAQVDRLNTIFESGEANNLGGPQGIVVQPDADYDTVVDSVDNCPNWANTNQAMPPWIVPSDGTDPDCDGVRTAREEYVGTDPAQHCNADTTGNNEPDAWAVDMNDNQLVSIQDITMFSQVFGATDQSANWNQRFDLNQNSQISISDITFFSQFFGQRCA